MTRWLCIFLLLLASAGARAMPPVAADDDLQQFVVERGILTIGKLGEMGQNVTDRASELVFNAMGFLGVPYRRGGSSADTGFDCSGFVQAMYQNTIGLVLPRRANEQAAATEKIDKRDLQPGDLVFFNTMRRAFSHVGIYIGDGKFIHSPKPGAQVRVESMSQGYWQRHFNGARRVLGLSAAEAQSGPQ
jgi:hypothetical protein